jgi:hypothetical protein
VAYDWPGGHGRVQWKDRGLQAIVKQAMKLRGVELVVGVIGEKARATHGQDRITTGELAAIHQFGTRDGHIPRRAFLSLPLSRNKSTIRMWLEFVAKRVIEKGEAERALGDVGRKIVAMIQEQMRAGLTTKPRLAPSTRDRTGRVLALLETMQLHDSITFELRRKGQAFTPGGDITAEDLMGPGGDEGDGAEDGAEATPTGATEGEVPGSSQGGHVGSGGQGGGSRSGGSGEGGGLSGIALGGAIAADGTGSAGTDPNDVAGAQHSPDEDR